MNIPEDTLTVDSYESGISTFDRNQFITYKLKNPPEEVKVWCAEITGIAPKYGFDRSFCKSNYYNESDSVYRLQFIVFKGRLYEYRNFLVDEKSGTMEDGFIVVTNDGHIMTIDQDGVRKLLHMKTKGDTLSKKKVKEIEKQKAIEESKFQKDDIPF